MRKLFVMVLSVATVLVSASAALAKGEGMDPVSGHLVITGPGLGRPIDIQGEVYWSPEYGIGGSVEPNGELTTVINNLGLMSAGPEVGWYVLTPDLKSIGPAYEVRESIDADATSSTPDTEVIATLYPYAPERPLVQVSVPLPRSTARTGLWWSAPPELFTWLVSKGLPTAPPAVPTQLPVRPVVPPGPSVLPMILFALLALALLATIAAVAGRRQAARIGR
jgi:hypothetical protein